MNERVSAVQCSERKRNVAVNVMSHKKKAMKMNVENTRSLKNNNSCMNDVPSRFPLAHPF